MKIEYLVVKNHGLEYESVHYCGESELEAISKYKAIQGKKNIFKAEVKKQMMMGANFIISYDIKEVIK